MRLLASLICGPRSVATLAALDGMGASTVLVVTHDEHLPLARSLLTELAPSQMLAREAVRRAETGSSHPPPVGDRILASADYVMTGMAMLDRVNWNGASFADMFRLYLIYVALWLDKVSELKPDVCWFDGVPHQAQDWALYQVCKEEDIPTIVSCGTVFDNSPAVYRDLRDGPIRVDRGKEREQAPSRAPTSKYLDRTVDELADQSVLRSQRGWAEVRRSGLAKFLRTAARSMQPIPDGYPFLIPSWRRRALDRTLVRLRDRARIAKQARALLRLPEAPPNDGRPKILFPLHFQPELTSVPLAMSHFDQLSAIRALTAELNGEADVLVKEHPQMLCWSRGWSRARSQAFYEELTQIPGVVLVSPAAAADSLMRSSIAIATLTGTAGYEARLHGVATICFGAPWYQPFRGVYRVRGREDLSDVLVKVVDGPVEQGLSAEEIESFLLSYTITAAWGPSSGADQGLDYARQYAAGLLPLLESTLDSQMASAGGPSGQQDRVSAETVAAPSGGARGHLL